MLCCGWRTGPWRCCCVAHEERGRPRAVEGFDKGRGRGSPSPGGLPACPHCPVRVPARVPLSNPGAHAQPGSGARACGCGTAGAGGGGGGVRAWSWLSPLPGSYSRVGNADRLCAGRCPSLTARVGSLKTFTGSFPAAASSPGTPPVFWLASRGGQLVISAQTNPASSRATAVTTTPWGLPWPEIPVRGVEALLRLPMEGERVERGGVGGARSGVARTVGRGRRRARSQCGPHRAGSGAATERGRAPRRAPSGTSERYAARGNGPCPRWWSERGEPAHPGGGGDAERGREVELAVSLAPPFSVCAGAPRTGVRLLSRPLRRRRGGAHP